jgi:hypothetical protein
MGDWSDEEIQTFSRRGSAMVRAARYTDDAGQVHDGISYGQAEDCAQQLLYRDRDPSDDRRVCFECRHLDGRKCREYGRLQLAHVNRYAEPVRHVLQRCDGFMEKKTRAIT